MDHRRRSKLRRTGRLVLGACLFAAVGCSAALRDRSVVWTEQGLDAADSQWEGAYREQLDYCRNTHPPKTPAAEACFGAWYDADEDVEAVVRAAVAVLRTYWTARAAGNREPGWQETQARVATIVADLPPLSREYFERIKGLK